MAVLPTGFSARGAIAPSKTKFLRFFQPIFGSDWRGVSAPDRLISPKTTSFCGQGHRLSCTQTAPQRPARSRCGLLVFIACDVQISSSPAKGLPQRALARGGSFARRPPSQRRPCAVARMRRGGPQALAARIGPGAVTFQTCENNRPRRGGRVRTRNQGRGVAHLGHPGPSFQHADFHPPGQNGF